MLLVYLSVLVHALKFSGTGCSRLDPSVTYLRLVIVVAMFIAKLSYRTGTSS